jgi:uncharacterized protein (DUF302 family)
MIWFMAGMLAVSSAAAGEKQKVAAKPFDQAVARQMIQESIQKFRIADDVSVDDAIESMKLRANVLNFKLVADLPLSDQIKAMGEDSAHMQILAFCDALIAKRMVEFDIIFAGFLPCRIAVVEDNQGAAWIVTMNMDMMLHAVELPDDLKPLAEQVRDTIYSIVDAGVNGDL